jgi:Polyketide cyclase / dehydrase and lipid transport
LPPEMSREVRHAVTGKLLGLAAALLLPACQIQRAPSNAQASRNDHVVAVHAATPPATAPAVLRADEPTAGSDPVPGSDIVRARATVLVRAPMARVREVLFDCPRYPEFLHSYKACTDEGPTPRGGRTWRMDLEELGGLIKLWVRVEISPVTVTDGVESFEGHYLAGNVRTFESRWQLEPMPGDFTRLTLESHMDPKLPLPASMINGGSVDGIRDAILAVKRRAEASP